MMSYVYLSGRVEGSDGTIRTHETFVELSDKILMHSYVLAALAGGMDHPKMDVVEAGLQLYDRAKAQIDKRLEGGA